MKRFLLALLCLSGVTVQAQQTDRWRVVWEDDFNGSTLDTTKWSRIDRGPSDWNRYMSKRDDLYVLKDGNLILRGQVNDRRSQDTARYVTGGVTTKGKYSFVFGKIEIRAKLGSARGAWPAFWMLCANRVHGGYPKNGEIDLMEHLNYDNEVYQTVHSHYTLNLGQKSNPNHYNKAKIDLDDYNVYGMEWYPDRLVFTVNGKVNFVYPKIETELEGQFPFDQPFYLLLDMQLGGSWVGSIDPSTLPVEMAIDWVRVYE